jgi:hypothetical protein
MTTAHEVGASVLGSILHYPLETGGWQLSDEDLCKHLVSYRDQIEIRKWQSRSAREIRDALPRTEVEKGWVVNEVLAGTQ